MSRLIDNGTAGSRSLTRSAGKRRGAPAPYRFALGWVLIFSFIALPEPGFAEVPKDGGTLRFGILRDISLLNPFVGTRSTDENVRTLSFESLLTANEKGVLPWLAESWEISRDGKTYTFQLQRGVQFHPPENREMTAEDIKWSVEYTLDIP